MSRMALLMLALGSPAALADTGGAEFEDTGAGEETTSPGEGEGEGEGEAEGTDDDTDSSAGSSSSGGDTGSSEDVPNGVDPEVLDDDDSLNTGSGGSPKHLSGIEEPTACGGSMALLFLPLLLGWRYRGS